MHSIYKLSQVGVVIGAMALGGCATKEDVERAQSTADSALSQAQAATAAAQRAQEAADRASQKVDDHVREMHPAKRGERG